MIKPNIKPVQKFMGSTSKRQTFLIILYAIIVKSSSIKRE
jgi:hypothetical protein